jgi:hypothetical protein
MTGPFFLKFLQLSYFFLENPKKRFLGHQDDFQFCSFFQTVEFLAESLLNLCHHFLLLVRPAQLFSIERLLLFALPERSQAITY